jgi:hypothetical protein
MVLVVELVDENLFSGRLSVVFILLSRQIDLY